MRIEPEIKFDFDDVLIRPKRSVAPSRSSVDLDRTFLFKSVEQNGFPPTVFPLIAANMDATGTFAMSESLAPYNALTCLHKHYPEKMLIEFFDDNPAAKFSFYTMGIKEEDTIKLRKVITSLTWPLNCICIDAANGYTKYFVDRVARVRNICPRAIIMAGNVATPEMVQELIISAGADIVKIGIGPGSVCTTRKMTGVGYCQLSAIIECADAAHGNGGFVCADGGCRTPGDVVKAFGAGADFVMVGGMLAGCDECEGRWIKDSNTLDKKTAFEFYGMSSEEAMLKYNGGVSDYKAAEGKCTRVPAKGPASGVLQDIMGGLRSACAYVGAARLKDLSKCTTFIRVNRTHNTIYD